MSLPFVKDDGKRKYVCFVCGKSYQDFETFKEHILNTHELGREFVVCPLERCGAPVRDLKTHFKVKHPHDPMPSVGQAKAIIWKDQGPNGKMKKRKVNFRQGTMISIKNGGKEMKYLSGMECEFYECLEEHTDVIKYDVEPFAINYYFEGSPHRYFPDLSILFADGHIEIWEVKPSEQTDLPINEAKWAACQQHCAARGWDFIVQTERGLSLLKKKIKEQRLNEEGK
jgi:hypothetical protein